MASELNNIIISTTNIICRHLMKKAYLLGILLISACGIFTPINYDITYQCNNGSVIMAAYSPYEARRHNAYLKIGESTYKLRQAPTASGSKYVGVAVWEDKSDMVWWIKGDKATLISQSDSNFYDKTIAYCAVH